MKHEVVVSEIHRVQSTVNFTSKKSPRLRACTGKSRLAVIASPAVGLLVTGSQPLCDRQDVFFVKSSCGIYSGR